MTDEAAVNRAIAESLEPKPQFKAIPGQPSPLGITNPAMRDLLQRKLLEEGWTITLWNDNTRVVMGLQRTVDEGTDYFTDTYDRIWPLAYMRAHGLEVK